MTSNQLRYWELQESKRANQAKEKENTRSNLAKEGETNRHNEAEEQLKLYNHQETVRHNLHGESISDRDMSRKETDSRVQNAATTVKTFTGGVQDLTKSFGNVSKGLSDFFGATGLSGAANDLAGEIVEGVISGGAEGAGGFTQELANLPVEMLSSVGKALLEAFIPLN